VKAKKCPICGAALPDDGINTTVKCQYCGTPVDLREPGETGPVIRVDSKVAISQRREYHREGRHHTIDAKANMYAGAFRADIRGRVDEARIELPGDGPGLVQVRTGSSLQVGSPSSSVKAHDFDAEGTGDQFEGWWHLLAREMGTMPFGIRLILGFSIVVAALMLLGCCILALLLGRAVF
jgi:hypothetical protein